MGDVLKVSETEAKCVAFVCRQEDISLSALNTIPVRQGAVTPYSWRLLTVRQALGNSSSPRIS